MICLCNSSFTNQVVLPSLSSLSFTPSFIPSWNPADDAQAVDRCYRIGQEKDVTIYRFIAAGTVEEKMYEKQVHKDGIKRVVLSSDSSSTARYFDRAELKDLFKLSPEGECATLEKFRRKSDNDAVGASGKRSFLTKHPSVIGVASHDALYAAVSVDVDLTSPKAGNKSLPFSKEPYQKGVMTKKDSEIEIEDLTMDTPLKPLGGLNKTRQKREDAKARRGDKENTTVSTPPKSLVENILDKVDALIDNQQHGAAMAMLLDVVDNDLGSITGDEKLAVHTKVAQIAGLLGWL